MKSRRKYNKSNDITYQDLEQLGLGSWLKENAGTIGAVAGIGASFIPGVGPALGMGLSQIGGTVQNNYNQDKAVEAQNKEIEKANALAQSQQQLQNLQLQNPDQSYTAVTRYGGRLRKMNVGGPIKETIPTIYGGELEAVIKYGKRPTKKVITPSVKEDFKLLDTDQVEKGFGKTWVSTSGKVPPYGKGADYYNITRGDKNFLLTTEEFNKAKDIPKKARGGTINYSGQLHEGPDGGVPVDQFGNPNAPNPVALVEKGEVSWRPIDGSTYVFSDSINYSKGRSFANQAKRIQSKYKLRLGGSMVEKRDALSEKSYNKEMQDLMSQQEEYRMLTGMNNEEYEELPQGKSGIHIKPENKGKFNALKKRTGKTTEELTHSKNPLTRKRAIFAQNAKKWKHEYGGLVQLDGEEGSFIPSYRNELIAGVDTVPDYSEYRNPQNAVPLPNPPTPYTINWDTAKVGKNYGQLGKLVADEKSDQWTPYKGMGAESAIGLAAPLLSNVLQARADRKRKRSRIKLEGPSSSNISLERERSSIREQGNLARGNVSRGIKSGATSQGQYLANIGNAEADITRNINQQLGESFQKEELMNAQLPKGPSEQAQLQAQLYNTMLDQQDYAQKQNRNTNMINAINMWGRDMVQSRRDADFLQMLDPRYQYMQKGPWYRRQRAVRINPNMTD